MAKKDYQALARAIHETHRQTCKDAKVENYPFITADNLRNAIADVLQEESSRFDRARFIEACETGKTKGMPR